MMSMFEVLLFLVDKMTSNIYLLHIYLIYYNLLLHVTGVEECNWAVS